MALNTEPLHNTIEQETLQFVAKQSLRVPYPLLLACGLITSFAVSKVDVIAWASWLFLVLCMAVTRGVLMKRFNQGIYSTGTEMKIAIALSGLNGIVHGSSFLFFIYFSIIEQAMQTMILLAICAGAVVTTVGNKPVFLSYLIPALLPISISWFFIDPPSNSLYAGYLIGSLCLMFGAILIALAYDMDRMFIQSFNIRSEQDENNLKLQAALAEAEQANHSKTRFLASASHDLRQPIHTMSLFSAALEMQELEPASKEIVGHLKTALGSLGSQLDALLDISKLDANIVEVDKRQLNLKGLLTRLGKEFEPLAQEKNILLTINCPNNTWVETDEVLFERILRNLLSNAIKYTDQGSVAANVLIQGSQLSIDIVDTGHGIQDSERQQIFEEFYQVSNPERDRSKGLGLGLAIVKRLIRMLDIKLELSSKADEGSTFTLLMPVAVALKQAPKDNIQARGWGGVRALVVDDEAAVGLGMKTLLGKLGCAVIVCDGTTTALQASHDFQPNLLLADFRLRGEDDGIKTIAAVRGIFPDIAALLISGDTAPDRLRQAKDAGIELLHKPVPIDKLKATIAQACELTESN